MAIPKTALLPWVLAALGCTVNQAGSGRPARGPKEEATMKMELHISGEGPPLVLVGNGLTGVLGWEAHAEELAPRRRVVRAQPLSVQRALAHTPLPADYSVRMESRALAAAIDDAGATEPFDLVGWSYGGSIALDFALEHPERIHSLVLVEADSYWVLPDYGRDDPEIRKMEEYAQRWADGVTEDELAEWLDEMLGPGQSRNSPRWPVWNAHRDALRAVNALYSHRDDVTRLGRFSKPVLLVLGEGTERYNAAVTEALGKKLPNARTVVLPGGHMAPVVAKDRFLQEIDVFQAAASP